MVTENTIKRINELYHKSKGEGLKKSYAKRVAQTRNSVII